MRRRREHAQAFVAEVLRDGEPEPVGLAQEAAEGPFRVCAVLRGGRSGCATSRADDQAGEGRPEHELRLPERHGKGEGFVEGEVPDRQRGRLEPAAARPLPPRPDVGERPAPPPEPIVA